MALSKLPQKPQLNKLLLQRSDGEEIHLEKQNEEERAINKKTKEVGRESVPLQMHWVREKRPRKIRFLDVAIAHMQEG